MIFILKPSNLFHLFRLDTHLVSLVTWIRTLIPRFSSDKASIRCLGPSNISNGKMIHASVNLSLWEEDNKRWYHLDVHVRLISMAKKPFEKLLQEHYPEEPLGTQTICELLKMCLHKCLKYTSDEYEQIKGTPRGPLISGFRAEAAM